MPHSHHTVTISRRRLDMAISTPGDVSTPPFHIVLILLFSTAAAAVVGTRALDCRWRFDACARQSDFRSCGVVLRRWCNCSSVSAQRSTSPCNCSASTAGEAECATAETRVESVRSANAVLSPQRSSSLHKSLTSVCNVTVCRVIPVACEWGPWKTIIESCTVTFRFRDRPRCCHPVSGQPVNMSCKFRPRESHTSFRDFNECYPSNSESDISDDHKEKEWNKLLIIGCGIFAVLLFVIVMSCVKKKGRGGKRRSPLSPAQVPLQPQRTIPENVINLQPGQPVATELLPSHFINSQQSEASGSRT